MADSAYSRLLRWPLELRWLDKLSCLRHIRHHGQSTFSWSEITQYRKWGLCPSGMILGISSAVARRHS
eukprot:204097-Lingulodinium_polyedra.AAC.1